MKKVIRLLSATLFSTLLMSSFAHADVDNVSSILSKKFPKVKPQVSYIQEAKLYKLDFNGKTAYTNENVDFILVGGQILISDGNTVQNITALQNNTVTEKKSLEVNQPQKSNTETDNYLSNLKNSTNNNERLFYINSQYINLNSQGVDLPKNTPNFITKGFPLSDAIKIVYGKGERKVVVLADPDCPYCQQFQRDVDTANPQELNLTMYIVPNPLSIHPKAKQKVDFLWCQPDKAAAWKSWMDYTSISQEDSDISWQKWLSLSGRMANSTCSQTASDKVIATAKRLGFKDTPTILFTSGAVNTGTISLQDFLSSLTYTQQHPDETFVPENMPEDLR